MIFIAKVINEFMRSFSTWTDFTITCPARAARVSNVVSIASVSMEMWTYFFCEALYVAIITAAGVVCARWLGFESQSFQAPFLND